MFHKINFNSSKGFVLVEVLVSFTILAIFITTTFTLLSTYSSITRRNVYLKDTDQKLKAIETQFKSDLSRYDNANSIGKVVVDDKSFCIFADMDATKLIMKYEYDPIKYTITRTIMDMQPTALSEGLLQPGIRFTIKDNLLQYTISAKPGGIYSEASRLNASSMVQGSMRLVMPKSLPDLIITGVRIDPPNPRVGDNVQIYVAIQNKGTAKAGTPADSIIRPNSIPIAIFIQGSELKSFDKFGWGGSGTILNAGETIEVPGIRFDWGSPKLFVPLNAAQYKIVVQVDDEYKIQELDDTNNFFGIDPNNNTFNYVVTVAP